MQKFYQSLNSHKNKKDETIFFRTMFPNCGPQCTREHCFGHESLTGRFSFERMRSRMHQRNKMKVNDGIAKSASQMCMQKALKTAAKCVWRPLLKMSGTG